MTLSTDVYMDDPCDAEEVFEFCRGLLGCTDAHTFTREASLQGVEWSNNPGQGLAAWLTVSTEAPPQAKWTARVNLDTAYGYKRGEEGCEKLHARLVGALGAWLDRKGVSWRWRDEFTGRVYNGAKGLDKLGVRS